MESFADGAEGAILSGLALQVLALRHESALARAARSLAGTALRPSTESATNCHRHQIY